MNSKFHDYIIVSEGVLDAVLQNNKSLIDTVKSELPQYNHVCFTYRGFLVRKLKNHRNMNALTDLFLKNCGLRLHDINYENAHKDDKYRNMYRCFGAKAAFIKSNNKCEAEFYCLLTESESKDMNYSIIMDLHDKKCPQPSNNDIIIVSHVLII